MSLKPTKAAKPNDRLKVRKRISQPAEISDLDKGTTLQCIIKDASQDGCQIACANIDLLPDEFLLKPANRDFYVRGKIVWRARHTAGAQVDWACTVFS